MSVQPTITMSRQSRLAWPVAAICAVVAVGALVALLAVSFGGSGSKATPRVTGSAAQDAGKVASIASLTPAQLAAGVLGTGYALPTAHHGPSIAAVLASMDPQTRRYTESIMALTFNQLAAGAAGQP